MASARGALRTEGFCHALDSGAWTLFQRGDPFDEAAFERAVARPGADADWIAVPDIVMGGMASLKFSRTWLTRLGNRRAFARARFMVAVQSCIKPAHIRDLVGPRAGVFVGGDTEWKRRRWRAGHRLHARAARYVIVGRVNSAPRTRLCAAAGAHSFDGSGVSRFAEALPPLNLARWQADVEGWPSRDESVSLAPPFLMPERGRGGGAARLRRDHRTRIAANGVGGDRRARDAGIH